MRSLLTLMLWLVLLLATRVASADERFDPAPRAKAIAPWIDEQTVGVAHVDLTRVEVGALFDQMGELLPDAKDELAAAAKWIGGMHHGLTRAGAKDVYFILTLARGLRREPVFAVILLAAGSDEKAIRAVLPGDIAVQRLGDVLVAASDRETLARLPAITSDPRPELAAAFAAAGDTAAQVLLLPPRHFRRVMEETTTELPKEIGGGPTTVLTRGLLWAAVGIDTPPKSTVRLVIKSEDPPAAAALRGKLVDALHLVGQLDGVSTYRVILSAAKDLDGRRQMRRSFAALRMTAFPLPGGIIGTSGSLGRRVTIGCQAGASAPRPQKSYVSLGPLV